MTLHVGVCIAWHRLATPAPVIGLLLRWSSVTLHIGVCIAWHKLTTPASVIQLSHRLSAVTLHVGVCNAWRRLTTPASVIWLPRRLSALTLHVGVCDAWHKVSTAASVIWLLTRAREDKKFSNPNSTMQEIPSLQTLHRSNRNLVKGEEWLARNLTNRFSPGNDRFGSRINSFVTFNEW